MPIFENYEGKKIEYRGAFLPTLIFEVQYVYVDFHSTLRL
jgi:hypothetical protein